MDTMVGPMRGHMGKTNRWPIPIADHGSNFMIGPGSVKTDNVPENIL